MWHIIGSRFPRFKSKITDLLNYSYDFAYIRLFSSFFYF